MDVRECLGASDAVTTSGGDHVGRIEDVEDEFSLGAVLRGRLEYLGDVVVVTLRHREEVRRRLGHVSDLHRLLTLLLTDLVVQPSSDGRAEAELASLQDDDADLAGLGLLLVDLVLEDVLGRVEL